MGNITDELFVVLVIFQLLLCVIFQSAAHGLNVLAELTYLVILLRPEFKVQFSFRDTLHRNLHLLDRAQEASIYPQNHRHGC